MANIPGPAWTFPTTGGATIVLPDGSQVVVGSTPAGTGMVHVTSGAFDTVVAYGSASGTICQGNDSRLSDSRAPNGAASGELGGTFPSPTVNLGHAGELVGGGGDLNIASASYVNAVSQALTVAAGGCYLVECDLLIFNNSGSTRTYTYGVFLGTFGVDISDGATVAASAVNHSYVTVRASFEVRSTSLAYVGGQIMRNGPAGANTSNTGALADWRSCWNTSASDFTGAQTLTVGVKSSNTTTTQTAHVLGWRLKRLT